MGNTGNTVRELREAWSLAGPAPPPLAIPRGAMLGRLGVALGALGPGPRGEDGGATVAPFGFAGLCDEALGRGE